MKPWIWLVLFLLTVAGGVYLTKKKGTTSTEAASDPFSAPGMESMVPNPGDPKLPNVLPAPRAFEPSLGEPSLSPGEQQAIPGGESGNVPPPPIPDQPFDSGAGQPSEPFPGAIPPPPPPVYPSPELDSPPEYFDGEVPQPFEPPPPLDENEAPVPPPYDPGAEL